MRKRSKAVQRDHRGKTSKLLNKTPEFEKQKHTTRKGSQMSRGQHHSKEAVTSSKPFTREQSKEQTSRRGLLSLRQRGKLLQTKQMEYSSKFQTAKPSKELDQSSFPEHAASTGFGIGRHPLTFDHCWDLFRVTAEACAKPEHSTTLREAAYSVTKPTKPAIISIL